MLRLYIKFQPYNMSWSGQTVCFGDWWVAVGVETHFSVKPWLCQNEQHDVHCLRKYLTGFQPIIGLILSPGS